MKISTTIKLTSIIVMCLSIFTFICLYLLNESIKTRTINIERQIEFKQLGTDLLGASDYLTNEVRSYVQFGNKKHLDNYWREVNETKTRDRVVIRLKELNTPQEILYLVETAKTKSDDLILLEEAAMKAVEQKNFDQARQFVFGSEYEQAKKIITGMLVEFNKKINSLGQLESQKAYEEVEKYSTLSYLLVILTVLSMVVTFISLYKKTSKPLQNIIDIANQIAEGNLKINHRKENQSKDEVSELTNAIIKMESNLRTVVQQVAGSSEQLAASSEELTASAAQSTYAAERISAATQQVAAGADEQLKSVNEMVITMNQTSAVIQRIAANREEISRLSDHSLKASEDGAKIVGEVLVQMDDINQTVQGTANLIQKLGERSGEISSIVSIITDIASQTNLLALNAAIEAARAGEHGRGFSVVADEVRKLAEQSSHSAKQISDLIAVTQKETGQAVKSMVEETEKVTNGVFKTQQVSESFQVIQHTVSDVTKKVEEVATAIEHMAARSHQIVKSIEVIKQVAEEGASASQETSAVSQEQLATVEEVAYSAQSLARLAEEMQMTLTRFKL